MTPNRLRFLAPLAAAAFGAAVAAHVAAGWGKITIHADERPLGEVIEAISRQSGKRIYTTLPPETKVTLHADRAELADVLETLAVRVDGNWDAGYAIAPSRGEADALFLRWARREREGVRQVRFFGFPLVSMGETVFDPFKQRLTAPLAGPLQEALERAAREAEVVFLAPEEWNPALSGTVAAGKLSEAVGKLAKAAGGVAREAVLLSGGRGTRGEAGRGGPGPDGGRQPGGERPGGERPGGRGGGGGFFGRMMEDPAAVEAMARRAEQRIAQLPKEDQAAAQQELEAARSALAEIMALPPEQRMAKMAERVQDPAFQQRMEERITARDFRMTPEQRLQRYTRYIERKAERSGQKPGQ